MHKRLLIILFLLLSSLLANAQLKVAILPATDKTGDVKYAVKMLLTGSLTTAISETEGYEAYDRIDLGAVLDEHTFQRTGMVSDNEIRKIGEMTGASYVLVTEASLMDETCLVATAKIVNVESARIENSAVAIINVDPRQMELDCRQLTNKLLRVNAQNGAPSVSQSTTVFVDLGLSVKWATCNLGASKPEEYGNYYAWGETVSKGLFTWDTYKWRRGNTLTKYTGTDNKKRLDPNDDVATVKLGEKCHIPTKQEWEELTNYCMWERVTQKGVLGFKVTSYETGKSIFLPLAGFKKDNEYILEGTFGLYGSSSLRVEDRGLDYAYLRCIYPYGQKDVFGWNDPCERYIGFTIRPVTK